MDSVEAVPEAVPVDTSSSSAYARPVTHVPEPSTSLPGIICRALCCGNKAAAHDEPTRSFPRNLLRLSQSCRRCKELETALQAQQAELQALQAETK